jgi:PTS system nitrogen regulatory IIA component
MEISELLDRNLINLNTQSTSKWEAILELSNLLFQQNKIESVEPFIEAVKRREAEVSTGVGYGIAIPHGISEVVLEPAIAFIRSEQGITYDSIDKKPVKLMFLFAINKSFVNNDYLKTLANLARLLVHKEVKDALMCASCFEDVQAALIRSS